MTCNTSPKQPHSLRAGWKKHAEKMRRMQLFKKCDLLQTMGTSTWTLGEAVAIQHSRRGAMALAFTTATRGGGWDVATSAVWEGTAVATTIAQWWQRSFLLNIALSIKFKGTTLNCLCAVFFWIQCQKKWPYSVLFIFYKVYQLFWKWGWRKTLSYSGLTFEN